MGITVCSPRLHLAGAQTYPLLCLQAYLGSIESHGFMYHLCADDSQIDFSRLAIPTTPDLSQHRHMEV